MTEDSMADLARLRQIAEDGRRQPLLGGRHLILWGIAVSIAALLHWGMATQALPWPPIAIAITWATMMPGTALIAQTPFFLRPKQRQSVDLGNRVERTAWQYGGAFLGIVATSIFIAAVIKLTDNKDASGFRLFEMMPPLTFGIYAMALRVTAEVTSVQQLHRFALLALGFAAASIFLMGSSAQMLVAALGYLTVSVLPGRLLIALEGKP